MKVSCEGNLIMWLMLSPKVSLMLGLYIFISLSYLLCLRLCFDHTSSTTHPPVESQYWNRSLRLVWSDGNNCCQSQRSDQYSIRKLGLIQTFPDIITLWFFCLCWQKLLYKEHLLRLCCWMIRLDTGRALIKLFWNSTPYYEVVIMLSYCQAGWVV